MASINSHKKQAIEDNANRDQISVLENDVESAQKAYDTVVQRYAESSLQSQSNQTNISVLTQATEPLDPSSPKMFLNLIVAVFVGGFLGVGAALVAELIDQRVRSRESLEIASGVHVLVEFTLDSETRGIKGWLKKFSIALLSKFRTRKAILAT